MPDSAVFKQIQIQQWRQFRKVDVEFHPRLTVLTGANGAGKSTLLSVLSRHFGWNSQFLATPSLFSEGRKYFSGLWKSLFGGVAPNSVLPIGHLYYSNGSKATLAVQNNEASVSYDVQVQGQVTVEGVFVSSHRALASYRAVQSIPTLGILPEQAYGNYHSELWNSFLGGHTGFTPTYRMKEALIAMATFGEGNKFIQSNTVIRDAYLGFISTLHKILPDSIGFSGLSIRTPDVVIQTKSGDFLIDASSGGLMTLIDLAWRIYLFSLNRQSFVVIIDEPENHLHPSMQRTLLSQLINAFPLAQFIVATHSPFMVSSVKDSNVYVLKYNEGGTNDQTSDTLAIASRDVVSVKLDNVNRAGSANQILREVLGVSTTIPEWVEQNLSQIVERHRSSPITNESLTLLRAELTSLGYGELFPTALNALVDDKTN